MAMGLGIFPEIIVDQHFHNRNRMARLLSAFAGHTERLAIGIEKILAPYLNRMATFK
jgi:cyanophycinase